jgi:two-component sensor histidine kinase
MAETTREIYHRMKNHLSMVGSLINLQKAHISNKEAIDCLDKLKHRVQSIALVHQNLYKSADPSCLNIADYIRDLLRSLRFSLGFSWEKTELNLDLDDLVLHIDTSFPLSLIINELVTNALQASHNGESSSVSVMLKNEADREIIFSISDSGPPFPEEIDLSKPETFGFQLITGLTEQLDGDIVLRDRNSSALEVRIPAHSAP